MKQLFARLQGPAANWLLVPFIPVFLFLVFFPADAAAQLLVATSLLLLMWYGMTATEGPRGQLFRILVLIIGAYITLRYIAWRGMYTISAAEWSVLLMALALYLAEIYSSTIHLLGCLVNVSPLKRRLLSLADLPSDTELPSVDVLVPSYNEDPEMLEITLRAALQLNYPREKLAVYLLDDGGTDQKLANPDPRLAEQARQRRISLQALCERVGAHYLTRPRNEHAKAGNLNHALQFVHGDLIAVLDADHVPTVDFLNHTVPWMVKDEDVFLVQTPHFMINPDPIDRNLLRSFRRMPSENEMFYSTIQRGLDFWSASFFCGSAALLRRRHLDEVGGIHGDSITEDAETAYQLHSKGYRSIYVDKPMVAGLAPETFTAFVTQRMRWAQGMIQILLLKRPFFDNGLKWHQRLGYMSTILFWLFPFARTVFLLAPLAYLYFGAQIYNATLPEIIAYTLPHLIASYMVSSMLFGRTRWPLISELYELMQSLFSLMAIIRVFINPRKPSFMVTPKGDTLEDDFISPLSKPFYILFVLMSLGFLFGLEKLINEPMTREMTIVVLLWNAFNFVTVVAALGALFERRQTRDAPRIPVNETGYILHQQQQLPCEITDLSAHGCRLLCQDASVLPVGQSLQLQSYAPALGHNVVLPATIRAVRQKSYGCEYGLQFQLDSEALRNEAVAFAFGDTKRWEFFQMRRSRPMQFGKAARIILSLIWYPITLHTRFVYKTLMERFARSGLKENTHA